MQPSRVSVVVPVFRNADTLGQLHAQVVAALREIGATAQFVFVDDASPDDASVVLRELQDGQPDIQVISNAANMGQQQSIRRGLAACTGDCVVVMDGDLQDPPAALPMLLRRLWQGESQAVFATRVGVYQAWHRMVFSLGFRALMRRLARLPKGAGGFVVLRRPLADCLAQTRNPRFYLAGLIGCHAREIAAIPVQRDHRSVGKSAYSGAMRISTGVSNILCVLGERVWYGAN